MCAGFGRADSTGADLPAELGEPLPFGRAEDACVRDTGANGLARSGSCRCTGWQPGEFLGIGEGFCGTETTWLDPAGAENQRGPSGGREPAVPGDAGQRWSEAGAGCGGYSGVGNPDWKSGFMEEGGQDSSQH